MAINSQQQIQQVKEDSSTDVVSGSLHAQGHNAAQIEWSIANSQGQFGLINIDPATGQWHYQLNNASAATNALAENEHHTEQFIITATDAEGNHVETIITVEVEGSNDLPTISGTHHAALNEHGAIDTASGSLIATDSDHGDSVSWAVTNGQGQMGSLTIDPGTGGWQYHLSNQSPNTLALNQGQSATETFTVTATDSSGLPVSQQITVQVNGSNESAQIAGTTTGSITEDKDVFIDQNGEQLKTTGQLTITDLDSGQSQFTASHYQSSYGQFLIDERGHWSYSTDNNSSIIQGLKSGEQLTDTLIIHSIDGTEQTINITINGTDDKALITNVFGFSPQTAYMPSPDIEGATQVSLREDFNLKGGLLFVDGALAISDLDAGQNQFNADHLQGQYGELSINSNGHWTYTANNSSPQIQGLKTGEVITDTLLVHSVDGTEQKITITINGNDDKAVIAGVSTASLTEDKDLASGGTLRADGQLTVTDPDSGQDQFTADHQQGQYGELSINSNGHWTYTGYNSSAQIQGLKTGEVITDTLLVHSIDGTEQKITVSINGTDDKAVIAGVSTASLTEDKDLASGGTLRADGQLTVTDPDSGQALFTADHLQGQYGELSINNNGHWTYTANNGNPQIQGLKTGETVTDTLLVHSVDGTEQKITVTINGTDDKAVIGGTSTASLTEDKDLASGGTLRADGQLTVTDP
ncbi:VCBS domain-containing protein, partial [Shewanella gelidimarina]|uniref:VCBS domain-containing protein n=1 Tax=Shewanella gelidimarina TaxID=56813 RepID=UPI00200C6E9E